MDSSDSWRLRLSFIGVLLICLVISLGRGTRYPLIPKEPQAYDADRHILFSVVRNGDIRVLNLFHNVAEIGRLHSPDRHTIHDMRLVPGGHSLWVLANDGIYRYDTKTLRQTAFRPLIMAAGQGFGYVTEDTYALQARPPQATPGV